MNTAEGGGLCGVGGSIREEGRGMEGRGPHITKQESERGKGGGDVNG